MRLPQYSIPLSFLLQLVTLIVNFFISALTLFLDFFRSLVGLAS